jgi:uncharacterized protein involved in type VI secretion and phage assembly
MELNKVEVTFSIGGKEYYIISLKLAQSFNSHHTFEVVVDHTEFAPKWMDVPFDILNLLGEDAVIKMKHRDGSGMNVFKGVITQVSHIGRHGTHNHIRISGCSPTIKLDGSRTMDSFMDVPLSGIVSEAVSNSGNGGKVTVQPKFTGRIGYIAQYGETCFQFLNRLSWLYGEWFFYDGETCYFGKQEGETESVTYEIEMQTFDMSANLLPTKMKYYHYLTPYDEESIYTAETPRLDGYPILAQRRSSSVYTSEATLPMEVAIWDDVALAKIATAVENRSTAEMVTISGTSQTSKVRIGGYVLIKLPEYMNTEKKEVGRFLVTSVVHEYNLKGEYRNTFRGVPYTTESIPMEAVTQPKAFPQIATVKDNKDEKQRGRVKVEFQWQKDQGKTTNWIRVATPDAGKSDLVPKNRGIVFIPEKGDIVMIDFEYGDPNRPYVTGSIFSERVSIGGGENNRKKSIVTRSGISIILDDEENKGSVTVKDPSGNIIKTDGKGNMAVTAPGTLTVNATDIKVNASNSIKVQSKPVEKGGEGTIDVLAHKTMSLKTETDDFTVESQSEAISLKAKTDFSASSETASMKLQASKEIKIESADTKINSSSTIRIKSNDTDVI